MDRFPVSRAARAICRLAGLGLAVVSFVGCASPSTAPGGAGGATGSAGASASGSAGTTGATGSAGASATGSAGTGATGSAGASASGSAGTTGTTGSAGSNATGSAGASATGTAGTTGSAGASATGTAGRGGTTGTAGAAGGSTGTAGTTASAGRGGASGTAGSAGTTGAAGRGGTTGAGGKAVAGLTDYWVGPNGLDTNPGTMAAPFQTITAAQTYAVAGTTIWMLDGTYQYVSTVTLSKSGTSAMPMNIYAVAGAKPVIDFSLQPRDTASFRGFQVEGDYWHMKGLEIENAGDNCVLITGSHNIIEQVVIHGCDDTGLQITVDSANASDATRGAYNTILNSDSYGNYDASTGGENADGFDAKLYIGPGNVFQGCRAWNNSDDGWDFFAANDVVTVTGCWSFLNGKTLSGQSNPQGDGNGFKLGGKPASGDANMGGAVHIVTSSYAFENVACGFTQNSNPDTPKLNMCGAWNNKTEYCQTLSQSNAMNNFTMTGAQAKAVVRNADGSLPAIH
jgi:hypothetical protein